jgi:hypothetical protein
MSALGQKPTLVTAPFCVCSTPESGRSQPALSMSAKCQKQTFVPIEAVPDIRIRDLLTTAQSDPLDGAILMARRAFFGLARAPKHHVDMQHLHKLTVRRGGQA